MKKNNFVWNTIGLTLNAFSSLFFLVIVNRINGTSIAGIFTYAFSVACLFYVLSLYYNRVYQISDAEGVFSNNQYITNRIITASISFILIILFCIVNGFDLYKSSFLVLLTTYKLFESISDCFHAFIQKKDELYFVGKSLAYKAIIGTVGFLVIDLISSNPILSIIWLIVVHVIGLLIEIIKYKKLYEEKFLFEYSNSINLFKASLPLFLFSFLNIYLNNCQKYVLEYFMEEEFQTILGIIIMPATMLSLCGQYLISPYLNQLSKDYSKKEYNKFNNTFSKISIVFIILSLLILLIAFVLGIPVLNIIYNINLDNYKFAFMIIIIGAIFYAQSSIISNALVIMKKNKEQLVIYLISSIVSTVSSIILIKNYAITGASFAYLLAMGCHYILSYVLYKLNTRFRKEEVK